MDVAGNINLMACDRYWSKQIIKPCSDPSLPNPDGTILSFTYKQDASDIITRVKIYDSKGNAVDLETGQSASSDTNEDSNSSSDVDLSNATQMSMTLSFYTGEASEGGDQGSSGKALEYGMCASNVYPYGTRFYIKGINGLSYGVFTVEDTGGSDFNSANRLDIYVGKGSDAVTKANNLGKQTVTAYKLSN
jgi:3D (Asp-Asp-Asp) domain-containing protein